jgi:hypothetical protein
VGALVAALGCALVGCTVADPIAVRLVDGTLTFAVCEDVDVDHLVAEQVFRDEKPNRAVTIWEASGEADILNGTLITFGMSPDGLSETRSATEPTDRPSMIAISLKHDENGSYGSGMTGTFPMEKITEDEWLDADGSTRETPCPS